MFALRSCQRGKSLSPSRRSNPSNVPRKSPRRCQGNQSNPAARNWASGATATRMPYRFRVFPGNAGAGVGDVIRQAYGKPRDTQSHLAFRPDWARRVGLDAAGD